MNEKDFTRQRSLPLPVLITLLLNLRKGSNEDELNRFFGILTDQPLADSVTPSALSQARKKLKPRALMGLSSQLVTSFRHHFAERRWHGLRLLAATGADDLLLYDRGYPAFWLFALHQQEQRHFCARLSLSFSGEVERFLAGGGKSEVVTFEPGSEAKKQCTKRLPKTFVRMVKL